jgi:hypothetical protein
MQRAQHVRCGRVPRIYLRELFRSLHRTAVEQPALVATHEAKGRRLRERHAIDEPIVACRPADGTPRAPTRRESHPVGDDVSIGRPQTMQRASLVRDTPHPPKESCSTQPSPLNRGMATTPVCVDADTGGAVHSGRARHDPFPTCSAVCPAVTRKLPSASTSMPSYPRAGDRLVVPCRLVSRSAPTRERARRNWRSRVPGDALRTTTGLERSPLPRSENLTAPVGHSPFASNRSPCRHVDCHRHQQPSFRNTAATTDRRRPLAPVRLLKRACG